jgi:hypothetical protein
MNCGTRIAQNPTIPTEVNNANVCGQSARDKVNQNAATPTTSASHLHLVSQPVCRSMQQYRDVFALPQS